MIYTKGIRIIHDVPDSCAELYKAKAWAFSCSLPAFTFNGDVFCSYKPINSCAIYIKTPFTLSDFEVSIGGE